VATVNGLDGVVAADTDIAMVDGQRGRLVYRGALAGELAVSHSFEEVAHLLWTGHLPDAQELAWVRRELEASRHLSPELIRVVEALPPELDLMSALRTVVSATPSQSGWPPAVAEAVRFAGLVPVVVARRLALIDGRAAANPRADLGHVANYLWMLSGQEPAPAHVRALEAYLVLTMEHGMNASTFASRVAVSTASDMPAALTAALAAMKGPLHGGAPSGVMDMLTAIGRPEEAETWMRRELEAGRRLMGFGHRIYRTTDPRAVALREVVRGLSGTDPWFLLAVSAEQTALRLLAEFKPGRALYTNVEYWAAAILRAVGIPQAAYTATFSVSRVVGWSAHVLEQAANNRLIRPQSRYVGPLP
jgi:citrate synthase